MYCLSFGHMTFPQRWMMQPLPPKWTSDHNFSFFHIVFFLNGWSHCSPSQQFLDIQNKSKFSVKCHAGLLCKRTCLKMSPCSLLPKTCLPWRQHPFPEYWHMNPKIQHHNGEVTKVIQKEISTPVKCDKSYTESAISPRMKVHQTWLQYNLDLIKTFPFQKISWSCRYTV